MTKIAHKFVNLRDQLKVWGSFGASAVSHQADDLRNKSPRGLNTHLNLRKLPMVHLVGVCHQLEKLWGPSPGAMCTI